MGEQHLKVLSISCLKQYSAMLLEFCTTWTKLTIPFHIDAMYAGSDSMVILLRIN